MELGLPFLKEPKEKLPSWAERPEGAPHPVPVVAALDLAEVDGRGSPTLTPPALPTARRVCGVNYPLLPSPSCLEDGAGLPRCCGGGHDRLEASGDLGGGEMLLKT